MQWLAACAPKPTFHVWPRTHEHSTNITNVFQQRQIGSGFDADDGAQGLEYGAGFPASRPGASAAAHLREQTVRACRLCTFLFGEAKRDAAILTRTISWQHMVTCAAPANLARRGMPTMPQQWADHDTASWIGRTMPRVSRQRSTVPTTKAIALSSAISAVPRLGLSSMVRAVASMLSRCMVISCCSRS